MNREDLTNAVSAVVRAEVELANAVERANCAKKEYEFICDVLEKARAVKTSAHITLTGKIAEAVKEHTA